MDYINTTLASNLTCSAVLVSNLLMVIYTPLQKCTWNFRCFFVAYATERGTSDAYTVNQVSGQVLALTTQSKTILWPKNLLKINNIYKCLTDRMKHITSADL